MYEKTSRNRDKMPLLSQFDSVLPVHFTDLVHFIFNGTYKKAVGELIVHSLI